MIRICLFGKHMFDDGYNIYCMITIFVFWMWMNKEIFEDVFQRQSTYANDLKNIILSVVIMQE